MDIYFFIATVDHAFLLIDKKKKLFFCCNIFLDWRHMKNNTVIYGKIIRRQNVSALGRVVINMFGEKKTPRQNVCSYINKASCLKFKLTEAVLYHIRSAPQYLS